MNISNVIPHLAAIAVIAGCAWLAQWQVDRAEEKREIMDRWNNQTPMRLAALDPPYSLPQPIVGVGIWDPNRQILIDNRIRDRQTGVHVLTPFRMTDGRIFLVDRGWAAWPSRTARQPDPGLSGRLTETRDSRSVDAEISGVLNTPPGTGVRLGDVEIADAGEWPVLVTYFDHGMLADLFGEPLQPAVIQLDPRHPAHLTGDPWKVVTFGPDRHIGYAVTWILIGLVVAGLWLTLTIRQARRQYQ